MANERILVLKTGVAGINFHLNEAVRDIYKKGWSDRAIKLRREADNVHDPYAISVNIYSDIKIGYLPRYKNQSIALLMDAGIAVQALTAPVAADESVSQAEKDEVAKITEKTPTENEEFPLYIYVWMDAMHTLPTIQEVRANEDVKSAIMSLQRSFDRTKELHELYKECVEEWIDYVLFVSLLDGKLVWQEAEVISIYFDKSMNLSECRDRIESKKLNGRNYEITIPAAFAKLVDMDLEKKKAMSREASMRLDKKECLSGKYVKVVELLRKETIACDQEVTKEENAQSYPYIDRLNRYIENKLMKYENPLEIQRESGRRIVKKGVKKHE